MKAQARALPFLKARNLDADNVWTLVLKLREKGLEKSTQRLIVNNVLSGLCAWAIDGRHMNVNPATQLPKQRRKQLYGTHPQPSLARTPRPENDEGPGPTPGPSHGARAQSPASLLASRKK